MRATYQGGSRASKHDRNASGEQRVWGMCMNGGLDERKTTRTSEGRLLSVLSQSDFGRKWARVSVTVSLSQHLGRVWWIGHGCSLSRICAGVHGVSADRHSGVRRTVWSDSEGRDQSRKYGMLQGQRSCREGVRLRVARCAPVTIGKLSLLSTPPSPSVELWTRDNVVGRQRDDFSKSRTKGSEPTSVGTRTWRSELYPGVQNYDIASLVFKYTVVSNALRNGGRDAERRCAEPGFVTTEGMDSRPHIRKHRCAVIPEALLNA
ncbi:hypothetical protein DFP72DRAFT_860446 [Ephemerocybe angulata]|uniref:Uncharacterized protein n=1 Tax=Ephemerocybe angulata TaxID=980116 RepID=A0A8H6H9Q8_9AGAR|nr:hypothetical protein DFP72DRAFT_860442 [Tulosesus angulatus]KAF6742513.1 hypothetical protein DFP72DRAFT_860446 [Tulosesus angulatus]